ncbi:hypothetical protein SCHPADRAFT_909942 [Schizopora paradoxa]|uniref:Uncharacterized protein n=1 Tax=Schizopora paradoxa TaxID=27342 RepID=A0A0H2R6H1_9AGAM|nr:hypothetical protein SCHPADRAFT_909942 [Schizopora paradoxa]
MASATLPDEQVLELLTQLQKTTPDQIKAILNPQPAIANAVLKLMIKLDLVNADSLMQHLSGIAGPAAPTPVVAAPTPSLPPAAPAAGIPPSFVPPHVAQAHIPAHTPTPPLASMPPPPVPPYHQYGSQPPPSRPGSYPPHQAPPPNPHFPPGNMNYNTPPPPAPTPPFHQQPPPQPVGYGAHAPPPPAPPALPEAFAHLPEDQKATIRHVISMTPQQVQQLPPAERSGIMQLRATLGLPSE